MRILFVRHAMTQWNLEKRYVGAQDDALCAEGRAQAEAARGKISAEEYPEIYTSPMRRCIETAEILFPGRELIRCEDLRESSYGIFEGRTFDEVNAHPLSGAWLAGEIDPPDGEPIAAFKQRAARAFYDCATASEKDKIIVTHLGCSMAILQHYGEGHPPYGTVRIQNAGTLECRFDGQTLYFEDGIQDKK